MHINQVSAILYTVRDFIHSRDELSNTLGKLSEIGFQAVELCGISDEVATPAEVAELCRENNLTISSAHENWDLIQEEPQAAAKRVKTYGCDFVCYPWPGSVEITDAAAIAELITSLGKSAEAIKSEGLQLCYHNHAVEFMKHEGAILMDKVIEQSDLQLELDTYWTQLGGCNPAKAITKWSGRISILHMKDMVAYGNDARFSEIGKGNLDWKEIIPAADAAGVKWFVIEQDQTWGRDPFESLADSFAYVKDNLVS